MSLASVVRIRGAWHLKTKQRSRPSSKSKTTSAHLIVQLYPSGRGVFLFSALRELGSSPGRRHGVVFLGKTLNSHSTSLHPGV